MELADLRGNSDGVVATMPNGLSDDFDDSEGALLRLVADMSGAAFALSAHARIRHASSALVAMCEYSVEELRRLDIPALVHPDHRALVARHNVSPIGERGATIPEEVQLLTKSGRLVWARLVTAHTEYLGEALRVSTFVDITDRKRMEDALSASEDRYRTLFDEDATGRVTTTPAGRIIDGNQALGQMLAVADVSLLLGRSLTEFVPDPLRLEKHLATLGTEGRVDTLELDLTRENGEVIHVVLALTGVRDAEGGLISVRGRVSEVTTVEQLKQQLLAVQRMEAIGRLAGGLAHDFNNILTVIGGHSERLSELLPPSDPLIGSALAIKQATGRAVSLTRQLLAFSRRQALQPRVIAVHRLVEEARPMLAALLGDAIELRLELPAELPPISADPAQLQDVIVNLAHNARDAMPRGGTLTVRVDTFHTGERPSRERPWIRVGSYVRLTLADTGAGVDAIMKAHVFEPFFTTKQLGHGSGLGLATVYGIVKQSNGYIWLESEVGHGASFTVLLPIPSSPPGQAPSEPSATAFETVLVVEDDESIRRLLTDTLRHRGYTVIEAASEARATEAFTSYSARVHLLLTEVVVGTGSGSEIARRLKSADPLLQVLYMSGSPGASSVDLPAVLGMPFIQKPFSLQALADKVREVLDSGEGRG
jgi:PAS domain S-box-containing protein